MKRDLTDYASSRRLTITKLAAIAVLAVVEASLALSAGAGASGARRAATMPPDPPALRAPATAGAAVLNYWTPARMAAAKPAEAGTSSRGQAVNAGNTATGSPGLAGGIDQSGVETRSYRGAGVNPHPASGSVSPADGGYPGPSDTFDWPGSYRPFPVGTVGKLFFTEPSGNFVCSAAATFGDPSELDMVWTAGHCVGPAAGGSYYTNWLFCPSYKNGKENPKVGCWTWASAQQNGGWYFNGYYSSDYAYLYMSSSGDKHTTHVVSVTGGMGLAWNWGRDEIWQDFGYPSASPYNGNFLVVTSAEHRYDVTNPNNPNSDPGPQDNSMGSSQTPGFSGGPWVLSFGPSNSKDPMGHGNWINGDNSYYFTSGGPGGGNEYGTEIQSPYYDTTVCSFWKGGSHWSGSC